MQHTMKTIACRKLLLLCALLSLASGCGLGFYELTIYPIAHQSVDATAIDEILHREARIELQEAEPVYGISPLDALAQGLADVTITENSHPFVTGVRTILPLFPSVMHILIREDFDADNPPARVQVYVVNQSHAGRTFITLAAQRSNWFGGTAELAESFSPRETDMIIYVGPINPGNTSWYQQGYRLVSLDQLDGGRREFFEQGISYLVPQLEPARIPALTYNIPGNETGISTLSVDTLLVASTDAPEIAIYWMTRSLLEQKARFAAIEPNIFSWLTEDFDPMELNFPLHRGARLYLERNEPGFLERYAETINLLVYLGFLILTSLVGLARWQARRKKNRVDVFYARVLDIRDRAVREPAEALLAELLALEKDAFEQLIAERLAADESFRIFTELLGSVREDLRQLSQAG